MTGHARRLAAIFGFEALVIVPTASMPVFLGAYVDLLHFDLAQAGRIASAETIGMALGSILVLLLFTRPGWNLRLSVTISLAAFAVANLGSAVADSTAMFGLCRFVSGFTGAGIVFATASLYISSLTRPGRPFAVFYGMMFLVGPLGLLVLPEVFQRLGLNVVYFSIAFAAALSLGLVRWYPAHREVVRDEQSRVQRPDAARVIIVLLLAALFINYIFNGGVWIYMERLGMFLGLGDQQLGLVLSIGMLGGLIGTVAAWWLGERWARCRPIVIGQGLLMISIALLLMSTTRGEFLVANIAFNAALTFFTPFYLAALARADSTGRSALIGTIVFGLGYGLGPVVLSLLVGTGDFRLALWLANIAFGISILLTLTAYVIERMPKRAEYREYRTL